DNTFVKRDRSGNVRFDKKEPVRRKTDGFHALIAALYKRELIQQDTMEGFLDAMAGWNF
ncbi:terminase large subunit, partial [Streptococcus danieliae]|nr:terminase large subunit [Streptococcus danieliae]